MTAARGPRVLSLHVRAAAYGRAVALRDVALEVSQGEIVGVAGHVGSGKSTLALAAAGLLGRAVPARVEGRIEHAMGGSPPASFVFANPWTQLTELGGTVEEEVAVGPENQAQPGTTIRARVDRALTLAQAAGLAHRLPRELSGGELQRVALASALALDTPLLVLDEPTAQLDPDATRAFAGTLRAVSASGRGILLVEQNLDLLVELAERVLVLADGRVLATGSPEDTLRRHPSLDARLGAPESLSDAGTARAAHPARVGPPLLEIAGLRAGYPEREVLHGVSLVLPRGSVCAWLGRNGAGKSTLARAIIGLVAARAGTIRVAGTTLDGLAVPERARHVGLVFQDPSRQLFARRVVDEVMFGPRALGVSPAAAEVAAREALEAVGLEGARDTHPGDLQPQVQRRLAIAAALAARPPLLILDEPTAGQDAEGRGWIARALALQRERGAAAVITHDLPFARRVCDDALELVDGRVADPDRARDDAGPSPAVPSVP